MSGQGKKKAPKRNGFFMFMKERRPAMEEAGVSLPRGWADLAPRLSREWEALSQDEKEVYTAKAKRFNERDAKKNEKKAVDVDLEPSPTPTSGSSRSALPIETQLVYEKRMDNGEQLIRKMLEKCAWDSQPIVVCFFTHYVDPEWCRAEQLRPAEIGLAAFSVRDGIIDNFGRLIDPKDVPIGKLFEVDRNVKSLGTIFPGGDGQAEFRDYDGLVFKINKFLKKYSGIVDQKDFCVFALRSEHESVNAGIKWLNDNSERKLNIRVLNLALYAKLASNYAACGFKLNLGKYEPQPTSSQLGNVEFVTDDGIASNRKLGVALNSCFNYSQTSSNSMLRYGIFSTEDEVEELNATDNYKYYAELCCVYHMKKQQGIENCALNKANRVAYIILEVVTLSIKVDPLIAGAHFPELDFPVHELRRRQNWLEKWGLTEYETSMVIESPDEELQDEELQGEENCHRRVRREPRSRQAKTSTHSSAVHQPAPSANAGKPKMNIFLGQIPAVYTTFPDVAK